MYIRILLTVLLVVALASSMPANAQPSASDKPEIPADAYNGRALSVQLISPANYTFYNFKAGENLSIAVDNPSGARAAIYISLYRHHKWNALGKLGDLGPGREQDLHVSA